MAEKVNPTPEEAHAHLRHVAQRISFVQSELVRRLREGLPAFIDYENDLHGYTSDIEIPKPKGYYVAPAQLDNTYINTVCVGMSKSTEPLGPRTFKSIITAAVYSIGEEWKTAGQIRSAWDRGELIQAYLYHFLTESENEDGLKPWAQLKPRGLEPIPAEMGNYDGVVALYEVVTTPENNNWAAPA